MGNLRFLIWTLAIVAIAISVYFHSIRPFERITALKVFGEYNFPGDSIDLELQTNRTYRLTKSNSLYLSGGIFEVRSDTVVLTERSTHRKMYLLFESEETLTALKLDRVPANKKLFCWLKFYPNGELRFSGSWKDGRKHGTWQYFDEDFQPTDKQVYEHGKLLN